MSISTALSATVSQQQNGLRLDQTLAQLFSEYSRGQLTKWIKAKQVTVDGHYLRPRDKVSYGQAIILYVEQQTERVAWIPQDLTLDMIYEDKEVIIVNKAAGMVVHPGAGNQDHTLVNGLLYHYPELQTLPRAGIVHRIDKDTTGLLMVARTLSAHNSLITQLQNRTVKREYQAISEGVMIAGGTVNTLIGRHHVDRKRMAVTQQGKPAITHYRVKQRFRAHTHISCRLETGRTHQIRVHMAHVRYPLVGDPVYGRRTKFAKGLSEECQQSLKNFKRQALHAGVIGFDHPSTGRAMSWKIPLPEDMRKLITSLEKDNETRSD